MTIATPSFVLENSKATFIPQQTSVPFHCFHHSTACFYDHGGTQLPKSITMHRTDGQDFLPVYKFEQPDSYTQCFQHSSAYTLLLTVLEQKFHLKHLLKVTCLLLGYMLSYINLQFFLVRCFQGYCSKQFFAPTVAQLSKALHILEHINQGKKQRMMVLPNPY